MRFVSAPQETLVAQVNGNGRLIDYRACLAGKAKTRPLSASPAPVTRPSPRLHRPPALGHAARPLVDPEHALARMAEALVEQVDVIASLGQVRDERSPHVVETKPLGLLRVGVADARPNAGEESDPSPVYGLPSALGKTSSPFAAGLRASSIAIAGADNGSSWASRVFARSAEIRMRRSCRSTSLHAKPAASSRRSGTSSRNRDEIALRFVFDGVPHGAQFVE